MPRGRPAKYKLPTEWVSKVDSSSIDQINMLLAEIAKAEEYNQKEKASNPKVIIAKEAYEQAVVGYKAATQMNKLKLQYALEVLEQKGGM